MIEARFNQCNIVLPEWSLSSSRLLSIPLTPSHRSVWAPAVLVFLAARNALSVCLNPRVKPSKFCLKLQCFEVKTTNIYFILPFCSDEVLHLLAIVKIAQQLRVSVIQPYLG